MGERLTVPACRAQISASEEDVGGEINQQVALLRSGTCADQRRADDQPCCHEVRPLALRCGSPDPRGPGGRCGTGPQMPGRRPWRKRRLLHISPHRMPFVAPAGTAPSSWPFAVRVPPTCRRIKFHAGCIPIERQFAVSCQDLFTKGKYFSFVTVSRPRHRPARAV